MFSEPQGVNNIISGIDITFTTLYTRNSKVGVKLHSASYTMSYSVWLTAFVLFTASNAVRLRVYWIVPNAW